MTDQRILRVRQFVTDQRILRATKLMSDQDSAGRQAIGDFKARQFVTDQENTESQAISD